MCADELCECMWEYVGQAGGVSVCRQVRVCEHVRGCVQVCVCMRVCEHLHGAPHPVAAMARSLDSHCHSPPDVIAGSPAWSHTDTPGGRAQDRPRGIPAGWGLWDTQLQKHSLRVARK